MSDEPTTIDWVLHNTRGHTPTEIWDGRGTPVGFNITWYDTADQRWDEEEAHMAECNQMLVKSAPLLRDEVIRLRAEVKRLRRVDKTTSKYLSFALSLLTDEQDCEYTHFVGGLCTHYCCPHGGEEE